MLKRKRISMHLRLSAESDRADLRGAAAVTISAVCAVFAESTVAQQKLRTD